MNIIDYIYVRFYAASYENLPLERKSNASSYISWVIGIALVGWISFFITYYYSIKFDTFPPEIFKYVFIFLAILGSCLIDWIYKKNGRYIRLYQDFIQKHKAMSKIKGFFAIFLFALVPNILMLLVPLFPK